ncbi:Asp/Glu-specific dipeptidyl-peptidase [Alphaproteobacteria bacterium SO-S41]|nr:Asp/Glu-specific dipeptidyl-peptidase [Alphaproteobacteria bacterium SO-S41]
MRRLLIVTAALCAGLAQARADEGLWTFDTFPADAVKAAYGWAPDQAWLDRVQHSAVRLSSGCSASIVSATGLVLTNWHCLNYCAEELSIGGKDYLANGFLAMKPEEEETCPHTQGEILTSISDVTTRVQAVMTAAGAAGAADARQAEIARIEDEGCKADPKTKCEVVTLYRGGQYKLYVYRVYDDMRVVFYPENPTGDFGGDLDNFNFPRFALDAAFLRLYEDGKPVATPVHLTWRESAPEDGELLFIAGNPGSTSRLFTVAQAAFDRDWLAPVRQLVRSELRGRLIEFLNHESDAKNAAQTNLGDIENNFKRQYGEFRALLDPDFFKSLVDKEADLRARLAGNAALSAEVGDPWADMEKAVAAQRELYLAHDFLEVRAGSLSELYGDARVLVRGAAERAKPNDQRLAGYADNDLPELERALGETAPVHPELERIGLTLWLSKAREYMTVDDPRIVRLLGKESPEGLAARLLAGTKLGDPAVRLDLWRGGAAAIAASDDPLIVFVRQTDEDARAIAAAWRERVDGPMALAAERLARARFVLDGASTYPDATGTLRLSYGAVKGVSLPGREIAPFTTIGGKYERATGAYPFALTPKWAAAEAAIDKSVVLNFATTHDFIGGNSGSPVIDREGNVVGAGFDSNIFGLGGPYGYDGRTGRAVVVATAGIAEALRKVYGADALLAELEQP